MKLKYLYFVFLVLKEDSSAPFIFHKNIIFDTDTYMYICYSYRDVTTYILLLLYQRQPLNCTINRAHQQILIVVRKTEAQYT